MGYACRGIINDLSYPMKFAADRLANLKNKVAIPIWFVHFLDVFLLRHIRESLIIDKS